jgi:hypothetical protein
VAQREKNSVTLAKVVGEKTMQELSRELGGCNVYIPKLVPKTADRFMQNNPGATKEEVKRNTGVANTTYYRARKRIKT